MCTCGLCRSNNTTFFRFTHLLDRSFHRNTAQQLPSVTKSLYDFLNFSRLFYWTSCTPKSRSAVIYAHRQHVTRCVPIVIDGKLKWRCALLIPPPYPHPSNCRMKTNGGAHLPDPRTKKRPKPRYPTTLHARMATKRFWQLSVCFVLSAFRLQPTSLASPCKGHGGAPQRYLHLFYYFCCILMCSVVVAFFFVFCPCVVLFV